MADAISSRRHQYVRPVSDNYAFQTTDKRTNGQTKGYRRRVKPPLCGGKLIKITHVITYMWRDILLHAVCITGGYLTSYWNRPFFPEWCSDDILDDSATYDTMVRIAGSFAGIAEAFKVVADEHGWKHIVLVSDEMITSLCWKEAKPFDKVFTSDRNYTFTWLRFGSNTSDEEIDDILQQIRSRTRGFSLTNVLYNSSFWLEVFEDKF